MSITKSTINEELRTGEVILISKAEIAEIAMRAVEMYKQQEIERIAAEAKAASEANSKQFYTELEVQELTGASHATLFRWEKKYNPPILVPERIGNRKFYKREDVEKLIKK